MATSDGVIATIPYAWTGGRLVLDGAPVNIVFFEGYEDKPWFKAKPVCTFLGNQNITHTLARVHEDDKASLKDLAHCYGPPRVGVSDTPPPNPEDYNEGKATYVNESGLYAMIMGSTKPGAKAFQRWVTSEVLPSIRRTGRYELLSPSERKDSGVRRKRPRPAAVECAPETQVRLREIVCDSFARAPPEKELKQLMIFMSAKFLDLVCREHPDLSMAAVRRRCAADVFGQKTTVRSSDVHLAKAAIVNVLSHLEDSSWVLSSGEGGSVLCERSRNSRITTPGGAFSVRDEAHSLGKDGANQLWISLLLAEGLASCAAIQEALLFYLDDFKESQGGLALRTTDALLNSGFRAAQLHSVNVKESVVAALRRRDVQSFHGTWEEAPWSDKRFAGIYLDLCTGSAGYAARQLDLAFERSVPGCVLAWTIVERNYEGEDFLLRHNTLVDLLTARGWSPAYGGFLRPSTLLHRSSGGARQRVLTQMWRKNR